MEKKDILRAVLLLFLLVPLIAWGDSDEELPVVGPVVEAYEEDLAEVCSEGSLRERSVALLRLAAIASPRFDRCLEEIETDLEDPYSLIDACRAIELMRDESPAARRIVLKSLWSVDPGLAEAASRAAQKLSFPDLWDSETPPAFWTGALGRGVWGTMRQRVTGFAEAAPWRDPAWSGLPRAVRIGILARAGSTEAVEDLHRLVRESAQISGARIWRLSPVEPSELVDRDVLEEALLSEDPLWRNWATESLARLGDISFLPQHLESWDSERCQALGRGVGHASSRELMLDFISRFPAPASAVHCGSVGFALLQEEDLYRLLEKDPVRWIRPIEKELLKRKIPLSLDQLRGVAALPNGKRMKRPETPSSHWILAEIGAILREENLKELLSLIENSGDGSRQSGAVLKKLLYQLHRHPSMVSRFSTRQRRRCRGILRQWYAACPLDSKLRGSAIRSWGPPLATLALFDSPEQREELWNAWLVQAEPLKDWQKIALLIGGRDGYAAALRQVLARNCWSAVMPGNVRELIGTLMAPYASTGWRWKWDCSAETVPLESYIRTLSIPRLRAIRQKFSYDLADFTPDGRPVRLAAAFLKHRFGHGVLCRSRLSELTAGGFPRDISLQAEIVLRSMCDGCETPDLPAPPPVSDTAVGQLETLFEKARLKHFKQVVAALLDPTETLQGTNCTEPPDPIYGHLYRSRSPSGILLRKCSPDELSLLRRLLKDDRPLVRREAEWTIWKRLRDPAIPAGWAREYDNAAAKDRPVLLELLLEAGRPEDIGRITEALRSPDPQLRLRALVGVRQFRLKSTMPRILEMISDPEQDIGRSAIGILGLWAPPEVAPMLLQMVLMANSSFFRPAEHALGQFHSKEVIGLSMRKLEKSLEDEKTMRTILVILRSQLLLMANGVMAHTTEKADASDARALLAWWAEIGKGREYEWVRPAFERMIRAYPHYSRDDFYYRGAGGMLRRELQSPEKARELAPSIEAWLRSVPGDDLWDLFHNEFVNAVFTPRGIEGKRAARAALETLLGRKRSKAIRVMPRGVLMFHSGRDCGSLQDLWCSARVRVEDCWYDFGLEEGLWP